MRSVFRLSACSIEAGVGGTTLKLNTLLSEQVSFVVDPDGILRFYHTLHTGFFFFGQIILPSFPFPGHSLKPSSDDLPTQSVFSSIGSILSLLHNFHFSPLFITGSGFCDYLITDLLGGWRRAGGGLLFLYLNMGYGRRFCARGRERKTIPADMDMVGC
ncbi:uncharacterized protein BDZ99DRAFT_58702 [Mytilinidion resinicola]|uniref:Uncharacterized protein n=1 Tax=Mytilinidion resinicola TaxID=574789 RepID=A0A6A6YJ36_9PEZI|nr:uncharacterized protein BDZ99DRAFT_58702 [Mytilinidion resinicola]KAF2808579.1 hypothetical protein BDZ99DRAFT_58702 [Mytilinidion resinicola]